MVYREGSITNLALGTIDNIVAIRRGFYTIPDDMTVHFINYGPNHLRVSIDTVFVADALLPYPTGEYMFVGQSVGVPLHWPVEFILPYTEAYINFNHVFGYL